MVDLHTHSTASDGELSPGELIFAAKEAGLQALALTDHDTLGGLSQAAEAAKVAGVDFVPGIELNIFWPKGEFHLLGLGIKNPCENLFSLANELQSERKDRNKKMIQKMREAKLDVCYEEFVEFFGGQKKEASLGRPHMASYLVQKKIAKKTQKAFDKFLGKSTPFYVAKKGAPLDRAIFAIRESGGVPVLAHPLSLYVSIPKLKEIFCGLKEQGVCGIEAWHPGAREADCRRLERLSRELGFFVTAGSDFHGKNVRAERRLGVTAGGIKIEGSFYEELKRSLQ